jgi:microcompartment protein CcmL/EutN
MRCERLYKITQWVCENKAKEKMKQNVSVERREIERKMLQLQEYTEKRELRLCKSLNCSRTQLEKRERCDVY